MGEGMRRTARALIAPSHSAAHGTARPGSPPPPRPRASCPGARAGERSAVLRVSVIPISRRTPVWARRPGGQRPRGLLGQPAALGVTRERDPELGLAARPHDEEADVAQQLVGGGIGDRDLQPLAREPELGLRHLGDERARLVVGLGLPALVAADLGVVAVGLERARSAGRRLRSTTRVPFQGSGSCMSAVCAVVAANYMLAGKQVLSMCAWPRPPRPPTSWPSAFAASSAGSRAGCARPAARATFRRASTRCSGRSRDGAISSSPSSPRSRASTPPCSRASSPSSSPTSSSSAHRTPRTGGWRTSVPTAKGRRRYEQIRNARTDAVSLAIAGLSDAERRAAGRRAPGARVARGNASGRPRVIMDATVRRTFSALRIPNYRRYFTGQAISLIGTWMQTTAQVWLVLQLTGSATDLGFVVALQTLPVLLLGPYGGLVADRIDKRRLMVVLQSLMGVQALVLATADAHGPRDLLRRLHPRAPARPQQLLREPVPAGLRARDGRRPTSCETRSASTRRWSTRRARSGRPSPAS